MGLLFSKNTNIDIEEPAKKLIIPENMKDNYKDICFDSLNIKNTRNNQIKTKYQQYAPDINVLLDIEGIKKDLDKFILINSEKGFTSQVNIYEYNQFQIVEKIYRNRDLNDKWYVDDNFINDSYNNELAALTILQGENNIPRLIGYDEDNLTIIMTYHGNKISVKPNNINLDKIPKNWKFQMYHILQILKKHNLYHNDITCRNMCLDKGTIYLIDFGNTKNSIDLYYRNYYSDLISKSENIIDFFEKIDKNAYEIRKCQMN